MSKSLLKFLVDFGQASSNFTICVKEFAVNLTGAVGTSYKDPKLEAVENAVCVLANRMTCLAVSLEIVTANIKLSCIQFENNLKISGVRIHGMKEILKNRKRDWKKAINNGSKGSAEEADFNADAKELDKLFKERENLYLKLAHNTSTFVSDFDVSLSGFASNRQFESTERRPTNSIISLTQTSFRSLDRTPLRSAEVSKQHSFTEPSKKV